MMFEPGVVNGRIIAFVTWKSYLVMHGSYMLLYMTGYLDRWIDSWININIQIDSIYNCYSNL